MATITSTHQLAVAKASLSAALLRPSDLPACSRDDLNVFHSTLDRVLNSCTSTNIQTCKRWILTHVAASSARTASLGKFLVAQAATLDKRRKKLFLLYLVHDVLHHTVVNQPDGHRFADSIKPFLDPLFTAAIYPGALKQRQKILRLLGFWTDRAYYPADVVVGLEELVNEIADRSPSSSSSSAAPSNKTEEPSLLLLPVVHGDPSIPFYDLPAGTLYPHIPKNVVRPINAKAVKPFQFKSITPSEAVTTAVQDFLAKVKRAWDPSSQPTGEPDAVGGVNVNDGGESYYGWSKRFCKAIQTRKREALERERKALESKSGRGQESDRGRGRRRSYSRSISRSISSRSSSRSRSRSMTKRRDWRRGRDTDSSRSRSPSRDRGRSRSASPPRKRPSPTFQKFQPPSSYETPPPPLSDQQQQQQQHQLLPPQQMPVPPQNHQQTFMQFPPQPPFPVQEQPGWMAPPIPAMQQGFAMPMLTPEQLQQLQMGAVAMGWIPNTQFSPPPSQQPQNPGYRPVEKSTDPRKR